MAGDADGRAAMAQAVTRFGVMVCLRSEYLCCGLAQVHGGSGNGCADDDS